MSLGIVVQYLVLWSRVALACGGKKNELRFEERHHDDIIRTYRVINATGTSCTIKPWFGT